MGDGSEPEDLYDGKNPAAVELGRLGGLKGGRARAAKLTAAQRSEIARKGSAGTLADGRGILTVRLGTC